MTSLVSRSLKENMRMRFFIARVLMRCLFSGLSSGFPRSPNKRFVRAGDVSEDRNALPTHVKRFWIDHTLFLVLLQQISFQKTKEAQKESSLP